MIKSKIIETMWSRRFWITVLTIAGAISLFMSGQIDVEKMLDTIRIAAGLYVGGLSFEDAAKKIMPTLKTLLKDK